MSLRRVRIRAWSFVLCATLLGPLGMIAAEESIPPLDVPAYIAALDRLSAQVSTIEKDPGQIPKIRLEIPKTWKVEQAGQEYEVSNGALLSALESMEKNPKLRAGLVGDVQNRLHALAREARALPPSAPASQDAMDNAAREQLQAILKRPEFRGLKEHSWWDDFWGKVGDWIQWILDKIFGHGHGALTTQRFLVWTAIVLAFYFLALWAFQYMKRAERRELLNLGKAALPAKSWHEWAKEALAAAARGDFRDAVHRAYWAGVYRLADLGVWNLDRARTPREYLRLAQEPSSWSKLGAQAAPEASGVSTRPAGPEPAACAAALSELTRNMETLWYAGAPASADDFRQAISHLEELGCRFPSTAATAIS